MNHLKFSTVEITEEEVAEYDGNKKIVAIERKDINTIDLKYGFIGEYFIVQIICGFVCIGISLILGFFPVIRMFSENDFPSTYAILPTFAYAIPLIFIGLYLILSLLKRKYYLDVIFGNKRRKIIFQDDKSSIEIIDFVKKVNSGLGYHISIEKFKAL